jgi:hypothetical protein
MGLEHLLADAFRMSDEVWERHANPWSVWTRYAVLPILAASVWSRVWFGWWFLIPVGVCTLWTWLNPRVFARPASTDNWASKAVLGERVWLNRIEVPIPRHHEDAVQVLNVITGVGGLAAVYGLSVLDGQVTVLGIVAVVLGKSWFLDRMVWLFGDMLKEHPPYREWLY